MYVRLLCALLAAAAPALGALCQEYSCGFKIEMPAACACTSENIGRTLLPCNASTGNTRLVAFWRPPATCIATNISLPEPLTVPCNVQCEPGQYLNTSTAECTKCSAGSYAAGPSVTFSQWNVMPSQMSTQCSTTTKKVCSAWRLQGSWIDSGNNSGINFLTSKLSLSTYFVRNGTVKFFYRVSSEPIYDGLELWLDSVKREFITGYVNMTQYTLDVSAGYHTIVWVYTKDLITQKGDDRVTIRNITLTGTVVADFACTNCTPGTYQDSNGQSSCLSCPANTYSDSSGATSCTSCPPGKASLPGSSVCLNSINCTVERDSTYKLSPCINGKRNKTYEWISPAVCDYSNVVLPPTETNIACAPVCHAGQELSDGVCTYCASGYYSIEGGKCQQCAKGSQGNIHTTIYDNWETLPQDFTTSCTGQCSSTGWRPANFFIDSGIYHAQGAVSTLRYYGLFEEGGSIEFNVSMTCQGSGSTLSFNMDYETEATYTCQGCEAVPFVVSITGISAGYHTSRWHWRKTETNFTKKCDTAKIYSIKTVGVSTSGASTACQLCVAGTYGDTASHCAACPAGGYSSSSGSTSCSSCQSGSFSKEGSTSCTECGAGTTSTEDAGSCTFNCSAITLDDTNYYSLAWLDSGLTALNNSVKLLPCNGSIAIVTDTSNTVADYVSFSVLPNASSEGIVATYTQLPAGPCYTVSFICDPTSSGVSFRKNEDSSAGCQSHFILRSKKACRLCTASDYRSEEGSCTDGRMTTTYLWITSSCFGGIALPNSTSIECESAADSQKWKTYALIGGCSAAGVVLVAGAIIVGLVVHNRRVYTRYKRLCDLSDVHDDFDDPIDSIQ